MVWAGLALAAAAPAQDALRSALSLDSTLARPSNTNAPVDLTPPSTHLGPVQVGLGLYASGQFNDNLFLVEQAPQSDFILSGGLRMGLTWPATEKSELHLNTSVGYVHYLDHSQYDTLEVAPDSALSWSMFFPDGAVTLFDQFSYAHTVASEAALTGLVTLPRLDNNVGARTTWLPGHWFVEGSASLDEFVTDSPGFSYMDRSSEYLDARAAWQFAEQTRAGIEGSLALTTYREHLQADNRNLSVGPFLDWQVTQSTRASLRGGPAFYFFDATPQVQGYQLTSWYVNLEVDNQLSDWLSHRLTLERDVQPGYYGGSDYLEQLGVNYSVSWALTSRASLSANAVYEHGNQTLPVAYGPFIVLLNEVYDHYGAGPSLGFQITDRFAARLAYQYWLRDSSLQGRGYALNTLSLTLDYHL